MNLVHETLTAVGDFAAAMGNLPNPVPAPPAGSEPRVTELMSWAMWGCLCLCIVGLMVAGALFAWQRRKGEGSENAELVGRVLVGAVIISIASGLISGIAFFNGGA